MECEACDSIVEHESCYAINPCYVIDSRDLLRYVVMNRSNVAIIGPSGSGKTTLIKTALKNVPKGFNVLVFDWRGDYANDCENYGRFSIDISGVKPTDVANIIEEAMEAKYGPKHFLQDPEVRESIIRALKSGVKLSELADRTDDRIARRIALAFKHFDEGPPLDPKPGITCVDLSKMDILAHSAYVLLALWTLDRRNTIYVVEEAYRLARTSRALLGELMGVGNERRQYFLLTGHSTDDFEKLKKYIGVIIKFPAWGPTQRYGALMKIYITNSMLYKELPGHGTLRTYFIETGWSAARISNSI